MWDYTEKVRDHYLHPRNVGEIQNPDGVGEVGNMRCGDALRVSVKLDDNGKIADIKFKSFGCGSAIASASMLTELAKGKTIEEASKISNQDIAEALNGLPREKMHCSVMGQEALEAAINFYKTGGKKTEASVKAGEIVCTCFNVTDLEIEKAIIDNKLTSVEDVTHFTKAGGGCGGCQPKIQEILDKINGNKTAQAVTAKKPVEPMTTLQKIDKIRTVIEKEINPSLEKDGGGCELVDVDGNSVTIAMKGQCVGCAFSNMTFVSVVEKTLKEKVSNALTVKMA
ncbi:MAG: Fe-S cluster assembly protein NifU [Chitinivibrionales bacterium]|nr:Fe-S cluster assembly protein NifU [Chitinivibrionales bacterium]